MLYIVLVCIESFKEDDFVVTLINSMKVKYNYLL